jgi:hypothetical protein
MSGEHKAKLRLTLERMRTEFAKGTPPAEAREMAKSVFIHNMAEPDPVGSDDLSPPGSTIKPLR